MRPDEITKGVNIDVPTVWGWAGEVESAKSMRNLCYPAASHWLSLLHRVAYMYVNATPSVGPTLSFCCVHESILCFYVFITALQIGFLEGWGEWEGCFKRERVYVYIWMIYIVVQQKFGEGNGTPLQYFCLENPMDGGAWWAAVHGVARVGHDWATSLSLSCIGEGNGNPLQCSCLENPGDGMPVGLPSMGRIESDMTNAMQQQQQQHSRN